MKRFWQIHFTRLVIACLMLIGAARVLADAGVMRLRQTSGPFVVTVFTDPAITEVGPNEVSVLVQRNDSGRVVLDGSVDIFLMPPSGSLLPAGEAFCGPDGAPLRVPGKSRPDESTAIRALPAQARNRLLHSARLHLPVAGLWQLRVRVRDAAAEANVETQLLVSADSGGFSTVWPFLLLPVGVIALFALHQTLSHRLMRQKSLAREALTVDSLVETQWAVLGGKPPARKPST